MYYAHFRLSRVTPGNSSPTILLGPQQIWAEWINCESDGEGGKKGGGGKEGGRGKGGKRGWGKRRGMGKEEGDGERGGGGGNQPFPGGGMLMGFSR